MFYKLNCEVTLTDKKTFFDILALAVIYVMAFGIPMAIIPASHNSVLIKLFILVFSTGLLLVLLGLRMVKKPFLPENLPVLLLLLLPAVTSLHVFGPSNSGISRILLVSSGIGIFAFIRIVSPDRNKLLFPLVLGGSIAILISLILPSSSERLAGVFGNANLLGSFTAALLPVGIAFFYKKGRKKVFLFLFVAVCFIALFRSGTRSSIGGLLGAFLVVFILKWKVKLFPFFVILFLLSVAVMVFSPWLSAPDMDGTLGVRQVIWEGSSRMFFQKPLFGWGIGSFQLKFPFFRPSNFLFRGVSTNTIHAHSEPLEILAESGLIGFFLWSALIIILLKQALGVRNKSIIEWGLITGVIVLLFEGLTSVALRWTSSVFLLSILLSLLPFEQSDLKKLPRWVAVIPLLLGTLLIFPGSFRVYRMIRASVLLNSARASLAKEEFEVSCNFCIESLENNSWELGSWYTLGNIYGWEALRTADAQTSVDLVNKQLEAYDSLAIRAPDFASLRFNEIEARLKLGQFDEALDDIIYLYKHNKDREEYCLSAGYSIAPFCISGSSFKFMNLVFINVLFEELEASNYSIRIEKMRSSILSVFAMAAINSPEVVEEMKCTTDSLLATYSDSLRSSMMASIDNELSLAAEGYRLYERYEAGSLDGLEDACKDIVLSGENYGTYHRAVLLLLAGGNADTELLDFVDDFVTNLAERCLPLSRFYPGSGELFSSAMRISIAANREDLTRKYFNFALLADSYGAFVMQRYTNCIANRPAVNMLEFWYRNGGAQASIALYSPTGILISEGETRNILQLAGENSIQFQIIAHFLLSSFAISVQEADAEYILTTANIRLRNQLEMLSEEHGYSEANRMIVETLNSEIDFLVTKAFNNDVVQIARQIKLMYLSN